MEANQKGSTRRVRRHSHGVLQELYNKGFRTVGKDAQGRPLVKRGEGTRTPMYIHPLALDSIITRRGSLVLLNGPNTIEVYKPREPSQAGNAARMSDVYLPAITGKMSNLQAARANLSHSCPYLYSSRRRGSASSVTSQRGSDFNGKQSYLKELKDSRRSNVTVTMTYLGQGMPGTTQDEMKVLQQICGGENICVFKGSVQPGEPFQFTSQRHLGYPFSATFYVNGLIAGRISSCCEYRYTPGFQQGRRSCFRLTRLSGGKPCYKCVNSRHGIGHEAKAIQDNLPAIKPQEGVMGDSRPSSPLFIPLGMEKSVRRTRKLPKEISGASTDSEDLNGSAKERKRHKRNKGRHSQQGDSKGSGESQPKRDTREDENKPAAVNQPKPPVKNSNHTKEQSKENPAPDSKVKAPDSLQDGEALSKQSGRRRPIAVEANGKSRNRERLRDFYEECVEMSTGLESGLDQQKWFKASKHERNKIKEQISSGPLPNASASEIELSEESDSSVFQSNSAKLRKNKKQQDPSQQEAPEDDEAEKEQELQKKLDAMTEVLSSSDEVEQLVLRNTGLTDDLLKGLAAALKSSLSQVTMINLNLNHIGPPGVHVLLDLLQAKPEVKGLLLFGNQLGDTGVQTLLSGLSDLQEKTALPRTQTHPERFYLSATSFTLLELDLGGNGMGSEGLRVLGTYMRYHSQLQYLGLAQTPCSDMEAWNVLFESLKVNTKITHIMLDENQLGDQGVKLFAEALRGNRGLQKVDLDSNGFGDVGGSALLEALLSKKEGSLEHLSLEENYISTALMSKIQQVVKPNSLASS
ncbi:glutamate-rich protein 3 [Astyanax mexicanus]|uniref:glutamate-rich protein 3 n=1 Tax=Astyanax mexicanus TaxID=7994 RepID=UPI0020CB5E72|nr:glutamate-rich protein 3 [Astyanax mexicanus]XP_049326759.1 glutamate-rich protein 3 [Astyanax mexicanus]